MTLVVDLPITKLDALEVIAFVSDGVVENPGTAFPRVHVGKNAWAEVQIPRFADPPPVAIDVCSDASLEVAHVEAARLADALHGVGWIVRAPHAGDT